MDLLTMLDLDGISALLLLYVLYIAYSRLDKAIKYNQYFLIISGMAVIQILIDMVTEILPERYSERYYPLAVALFFALYVISPFVTYFWAKFVRAWIYQNTKNKTVDILLLIPVAACELMAVLSIWNGMVFRVTKTVSYTRGPFFRFHVALMSVALLYSLFFTLKNRRKFQNHEFVPLLLFPTVPSIAGLLQSACNGLLIIWGSTAIALVVVFIFLQQKMLQVDPLTGTWTKSSFENYVTYRLDHLNAKTGLIFVDLNQFKMINDTYGHLEGDAALAKAAHLLKISVGTGGIVARFGGDEFVIVMENVSESKLKKLDGKLHGAFDEYNNKSGKPYRLSISSGCGMYHSSKDIWQFINHVDYLMYQNKKSMINKI